MLQPGTTSCARPRRQRRHQRRAVERYRDAVERIGLTLPATACGDPRRHRPRRHQIELVVLLDADGPSAGAAGCRPHRATTAACCRTMPRWSGPSASPAQRAPASASAPGRLRRATAHQRQLTLPERPAAAAGPQAPLLRPLRLANVPTAWPCRRPPTGASAGYCTVFAAILGTGVGGGVVVVSTAGRRQRGVANGANLRAALPAADRPPATPAIADRGCIESWPGPGHLRMRGDPSTLQPSPARPPRAGERPQASLERYESAARSPGVINLLDPEVAVLGGGPSQIARLYEHVPRRWAAHVFRHRVHAPVAGGTETPRACARGGLAVRRTESASGEFRQRGANRDRRRSQAYPAGAAVLWSDARSRLAAGILTQLVGTRRRRPRRTFPPGCPGRTITCPRPPADPRPAAAQLARRDALAVSTATHSEEGLQRDAVVGLDEQLRALRRRPVIASAPGRTDAAGAARSSASRRAHGAGTRRILQRRRIGTLAWPGAGERRKPAGTASPQAMRAKAGSRVRQVQIERARGIRSGSAPLRATRRDLHGRRPGISCWNRRSGRESRGNTARRPPHHPDQGEQGDRGPSPSSGRQPGCRPRLQRWCRAASPTDCACAASRSTRKHARPRERARPGAPSIRWAPRPKGWMSWSPRTGQACGIGPSQPQ